MIVAFVPPDAIGDKRRAAHDQAVFPKFRVKSVQNCSVFWDPAAL
jgi:hypothetical protein